MYNSTPNSIYDNTYFPVNTSVYDIDFIWQDEDEIDWESEVDLTDPEDLEIEEEFVPFLELPGYEPYES